MTTRQTKAARMNLKRKAGFRKLPDPSGPVALPRGPRYLVAHACFSCRLSFKRAVRSDGPISKCPSCGGLLSAMGRGFKAPLRRDQEQWKLVALLYAAGFRFPSTTIRASPPLPTRLREASAFIQANPSHLYRVCVT